ncbi:unnamed protein product, partial [Symbiodinium sp. KB8]
QSQNCFTGAGGVALSLEPGNVKEEVNASRLQLHIDAFRDASFDNMKKDFDILTGQKKLLGLLTPFVLELVGMAEARQRLDAIALDRDEKMFVERMEGLVGSKSTPAVRQLNPFLKKSKSVPKLLGNLSRKLPAVQAQAAPGLVAAPNVPKAKAVIDTTRPDIAMIELDEERLDRMREAPPPDPVPEHLQPITISAPAQGSAPAFKLETSCQRAVWNAEVAGERITGEVVFDADDEYGISEENNAYLGRGDFVSLVRRGSENGEFAPFALKAHRAASAGASAVICADVEEGLPAHRIGAATFWGDVRIAWKTKSCTFPSIPVLLLPKADGEKLMELCKSGRCLTADFTVKSDPYPRRTLAKKLCQAMGHSAPCPTSQYM